MSVRNLIWITFIFLVACSASIEPAEPVVPASPTESDGRSQPTRDNPRQTLAAPTPTLPPAATNPRVVSEETYSFSSMLPFDAIRPIYNPQFTTAAEASLVDEELVMGVTLGGKAKAYPITVLRSREMVNDELAGIPVLVTW